MFTPNFGWGHQLASVFGVVIWVLLCLLAFSVVVALVFLLVRFLLVGTRAAQLYVARHEPPRTMPAAEPPVTEPPATEPPVTEPTVAEPPAPSAGDGAPPRAQGAHAVVPDDDAQAGVSTPATAADPAAEPMSPTELDSATRPLPDTTETEQLPKPPRARTPRTPSKSAEGKPPTTRTPRTPKTPPSNPAE